MLKSLFFALFTLLPETRKELDAASIQIVEQSLFVHASTGLTARLGTDASGFYSNSDANNEGTFG